MINSKVNAIIAIRDLITTQNHDLVTVKDVVEGIMKLGVVDFLTELALPRTIMALRDALNAVDEKTITTTTTEVSKILNNMLTDIDMKVKR